MNPVEHWETIVVTAEALVREVLPGSSWQANTLIDEVLIIIDLGGFRFVQIYLTVVMTDCNLNQYREVLANEKPCPRLLSDLSRLLSGNVGKFFLVQENSLTMYPSPGWAKSV